MTAPTKQLEITLGGRTYRATTPEELLHRVWATDYGRSAIAVCQWEYHQPDGPLKGTRGYERTTKGRFALLQALRDREGY